MKRVWRAAQAQRTGSLRAMEPERHLGCLPSDPDYPARYKNHLKAASHPLLRRR